mmetsp:Transcript_49937/g.156309  ORF Transcript_49937/g.156309 Transcript_49937/m.156309 type:complete len:205 (+) Transcript_49937:1558-2172(+)
MSLVMPSLVLRSRIRSNSCISITSSHRTTAVAPFALSFFSSSSPSAVLACLPPKPRSSPSFVLSSTERTTGGCCSSPRDCRTSEASSASSLSVSFSEIRATREEKKDLETEGFTRASTRSISAMLEALEIITSICFSFTAPEAHNPSKRAHARARSAPRSLSNKFGGIASSPPFPLTGTVGASTFSGPSVSWVTPLTFSLALAR